MSKHRVFFWSVFSRIRTEYRDFLRISPYLVRMRENTDQKKLHIWTLFTQCKHNSNILTLSNFSFIFVTDKIEESAALIPEKAMSETKTP